MSEQADQAIILFDGIYNFCNGAVQFISYSSVEGRKNIISFSSRPSRFGSMIFIENELVFHRIHSAALRIARKLDGFWITFFIFISGPKAVEIYCNVVLQQTVTVGSVNKNLV